MAWKDKRNGKGPFPMHAGEYCGNFHPSTEPRPHLHETPPEEAAKSQAALLSKMRFGKPRPCPAGTSDEMAAQGYVGLYLKEDRPPHFEWEEPILTPPELMEPGYEHLYNIDGKPGMVRLDIDLEKLR